MKKDRIAAILSLTVLLVCTGLTHASAKPMINSIRFESPSATEDRVIFELNGPHLPTGKALPGDNPRVYFDFPDTAPADRVKTSMPANGNFVKQIRYAYHKGEKSKTRVVFDLTADRKIDFKQDFDKETNTLVITLYLAGTTPEPIIKAIPEPEPVPAEEPGRPETAAEDVGKEIRLIEDVNIAVAEKPKEIAPAPEAVMPEPPDEVAIPEPEQARPEPPAEVAMPAPEPESKPVTAVPEPEPAPAPQEELPQIAGISPSTRTEDMLEEPGEEATIIQPLSEIGIQSTEGIGSEPTILHSIEFDPKSNRGEMISFKLNGFNPPVVFGIEEDVPRIVCFFKNTSAGSELSDMLDINGQYVTNIKVGKYKNPDNIRVVLELVPGNNYDLQQIFFKDDQIFMMIINKAGKQISTQSN
jgi:hypothetical protein